MMKWGSLIGKWTILVGNCNGFVGNRMINFYSAAARSELRLGVLPSQVAVLPSMHYNANISFYNPI